MLEATIFTSTGVGVTIAFGSTRYFTAIQNVGRVKSSVDDLIMERGTVSMRVAFVLRSAEVQPLFRDLCERENDDYDVCLYVCLFFASQFFPPPSIDTLLSCISAAKRAPLCA